MEYPRYKEWMGKDDHKLTKSYIAGVKEFVKYARRNLGDDRISCPCNRCMNGKNQDWEEVEVHLLKWGMQKDYVKWVFHGERKIPFIPEQIPVENIIRQEGDPLHQSGLNDLINDTYGLHGDHPNLNVEDDDGNLDLDYIKLKAAASRPLYNNCNPEHTTLYATVGLHNIKSQFGLSGNSVTEILKWARDLLPKENTLPDNYPNMKTSLKGLGMKYKSIHVCKFDCILYRKEHKHKLKCPVCNELRYMQKVSVKNLHIEDTKVPHKILRYFPLGPRLARLYTIPWIAESMTWHARAEVGENLMRHPFDSPVWKDVNSMYPEFAQEDRNVRLGISTDGFNPFGNLSTNKSIWPVFVFPYNLPPSLCMKKEFSILSLIIPGPKAPSDDIDIFLAPVVEELNELWLKGRKAFDSFRKQSFTLKAILLWAIHDFPTYGTLSGCNVHGFLGCPVCAEETEST